MAKNSEIPPSEAEYRNTFRDARGLKAMKLDYFEKVSIASDGASKVVKKNDYQQLGDDRLMTALMLARGKIDLMICNLCRYPPAPPWWERLLWWRQPERPSLGIMARESGDSCAGCSHFVCKRHSAVVADGSVRCLPCARRFRLHAFVRWLFFTPVREDS